MFPGHLCRDAGGGEHGAEQRGRRRLAVRAGDADEAVSEQAGAELDLGDHLDAASAGGGDRRRVARHARALDDEPDAVEQRVAPRAQLDVGVEPGWISLLGCVVGDDLPAVTAKRGHSGAAGTGQAEDEGTHVDIVAHGTDDSREEQGLSG